MEKEKVLPSDPEIEADLDNPEYYDDDWLHSDEVEDDDQQLGMVELMEQELEQAMENERE
jgi:hypothetical protein